MDGIASKVFVRTRKRAAGRFITSIQLISCTLYSVFSAQAASSYAPSFIWCELLLRYLLNEAPLRDHHLDCVQYLGINLWRKKAQAIKMKIWRKSIEYMMPRQRHQTGFQRLLFTCNQQCGAFWLAQTQIKQQNFWNSNRNFPNYKILGLLEWPTVRAWRARARVKSRNERNVERSLMLC